MDFPIAIDRDARATVPELDPRQSLVTLTDSTLAVRFGELFRTEVALQTIASVQSIPDPRPQTFLPMGVSAAVNTLGSDTVSLLGSHDGLVQIDFLEPVQGHLPPPKETPNSETNATDGTVMLGHLVISLQDHDRFIQMLDEQRRTGVALTSNPDDAQSRAWPTGG